MTWLWMSLMAGVINIALGELLDVFPPLARKVIANAARRLPAVARERYEAEWLAELEALGGLRVSKVLFALSVLQASRRLAAQLTPETAQAPVRRQKPTVQALAEWVFWFHPIKKLGSSGRPPSDRDND